MTGETATALELTVRVVTTPYLSSSGFWSTIPADHLTTTVEQQPGALVYRFTLKPGTSLGAGSYTFAVQYHHAVGGRDPGRDTYRATATVGGRPVAVSGGF
ncbi:MULTISPECIES: hypothetical protein [unclassified Actinoplanes]|uniref:hypothetical protein n=1 Tax=unclassified Actinoplanes TaxID=2626549 RepID=UPI0012BACAEB|nr:MULTISPECIES: hypothetical protein [unclassified Actinoplanes]